MSNWFEPIHGRKAEKIAKFFQLTDGDRALHYLRQNAITSAIGYGGTVPSDQELRERVEQMTEEEMEAVKALIALENA